MTLRKISKEQPEKFEFNQENFEEAINTNFISNLNLCYWAKTYKL